MLYWPAQWQYMPVLQYCGADKTVQPPEHRMMSVVLLHAHATTERMALTCILRALCRLGLVEKRMRAYVCTPAPTVWPTPCTPVLSLARAPVMKVCTVAPPSSMRLARRSEVDGAACIREQLSPVSRQSLVHVGVATGNDND